MILLTIGLSLSICAIGVLYYLNNQLKKTLKNNNKALQYYKKNLLNIRQIKINALEMILQQEKLDLIEQQNVLKKMKIKFIL